MTCRSVNVLLLDGFTPLYISLGFCKASFSDSSICLCNIFLIILQNAKETATCKHILPFWVRFTFRFIPCKKYTWETLLLRWISTSEKWQFELGYIYIFWRWYWMNIPFSSQRLLYASGGEYKHIPCKRGGNAKLFTRQKWYSRPRSVFVLVIPAYLRFADWIVYSAYNWTVRRIRMILAFPISWWAKHMRNRLLLPAGITMLIWMKALDHVWRYSRSERS